jgi:DNA-binding LytR/AlgR family response regulator
MNIVLIEDEKPALARITKLITEILPSAKIIAHHDSVQSAREWFSGNPSPDLVMLDIQLADGTAFDLLKQIAIGCPIIFTTAFDRYAIDAFKANSIDYLLKPVKKEELETALKKLEEYRNIFGNKVAGTPAASQSLPPLPVEYKKRFIIRFGEHIKTLPVESISYFVSENKSTFARTFDGMKYPMDHNLDALELMLDTQDFFRINRQFIINIKSIDEMKVYTKARVIVRLNPPVKDPPIVSSERAADFKLWLAGEFPNAL